MLYGNICIHVYMYVHIRNIYIYMYVLCRTYIGTNRFSGSMENLWDLCKIDGFGGCTWNEHGLNMNDFTGCL